MAKEDVFKKAFNEVLVFDVNGDGAFSRHELFSYDPQLRASTISNAKERMSSLFGLNEADMTDMITTAVAAFFDQDLLQAVRMFLVNAKGSFGLVANSSLDAHRQIVTAARGQTISIAMYPQSGVILWASEQAACKAGLSILDEQDETGKGRAFRLDLDDLGGEVHRGRDGEGHPGDRVALDERPHADGSDHQQPAGQDRHDDADQADGDRQRDEGEAAGAHGREPTGSAGRRRWVMRP